MIKKMHHDLGSRVDAVILLWRNKLLVSKIFIIFYIELVEFLALCGCDSLQGKRCFLIIIFISLFVLKAEKNIFSAS